MRKIIYIIPGYEGSPKDKTSLKVAKIFTKKGFEAIVVNIDWHYKKQVTFAHYVKDFLKVYKRPRNSKVYVLGFSFGATIAFLSEPKTRPNMLILCSLSPYFKEDFERLDSSWIKWWKENFTRSNYSFNKLAPSIKSEVHLFVGSKEDDDGTYESIFRAKEAVRRIKNAKLTIIKGAEHDMRQKVYQNALKRLIV